jgi:metal transporter CNNM
MSVIFYILGSLILLVMSGLFSGLTLGLLGLDPLSLKIVANGDTHNAVYAKKIIPIREKGNLLLCTLLLGNVAVNAALSILLAEFAGGLLSFILSTAFIVIFGEIIPQAACSRYALYIGSKVIRIVQVLVLLIFPLAWPISKCLDWLLGDELGTIYTNRELGNLVEAHATQGELPMDSAKIMQGALDFSGLTVQRVMTEWKDVFYLYSDTNLDFDALESIFKSGHSRVPVITRPTRRECSQVIGLLFVKDLILLDPEDELPVQNIIDTFHHDLKIIDFNANVKSVMSEFLHGRSHLAIVGTPGAEMIGIVTLEDIIENILRMEIEDEFDYNAGAITEKSRNDEILKLFDYRRTRGMDGGMPPQEKLVVYRHLCREVEVFTQQHRTVEDVDLQNLLSSGRVHKVIQDRWLRERTSDAEAKANLMIEEGGHLLYNKGVQTEFFTMILDGKAEVFSGRQKFRTEVSRFTILCPELLSQTQRDHKEGLEFSAFVPDFTARVIQNSRVLRIPRENFLKCLLGKLRNYSRPFKETRDKLREINLRQWSVPTNAYASVSLSNLNLASDVKSVPQLLKASSTRQRFYDETYVGHKHDVEGKRKLAQSSPNLTTQSDTMTLASIDNGKKSEVQVLEVV